MKAHFEQMAGYNAWANGRLFAAAAALTEAQAWEDMGAAFGSVQRTLNHVLVADLIWLARFRGQKPPGFALDHILHDDRLELAAARRLVDGDILWFARDQTEDSLAGMIQYTRATAPEPYRQTLASAMAHFFNHQTHHRGQVHALLTQATGVAPSLDLVAYQREVHVP